MAAGRNSGTADKLAELHERIVEGVETLAGSEQWRAWLAVAARFPRYSLNNTLAIMLQAPQASLVCGFRRWQGMGRQVCKGERGIAILAPCAYKVSPTSDGEQGAGREPGQPGPDGAEPRRQLRGFKVAYVFDVSQTDGEPLPEPAAPQLLTGQAPAGLWDALAEQVGPTGTPSSAGTAAPRTAGPTAPPAPSGSAATSTTRRPARPSPTSSRTSSAGTPTRAPSTTGPSVRWSPSPSPAW